MAIVLLADQQMVSNPELCVCEEGTYGENDLVQVYQVNDSEKLPLCSYSAVYIATGSNLESAAESAQDWDGLVSEFRGTATFQKCFTTANVNAWSLLLVSLMQTHHIQDLYFAFQNVRTGIPEPYQLTEGDILEINQILQQHHIPLIID